MVKISKSSGFTMVEILLTIVIISVMASIGMVMFSAAQTKNRDNIRRSDLNNLKVILHFYNRDKGSFIPWTNPSDGTSTQLLWSASVADPTLGAYGLASNSLKTVFTPKYIAIIPRDPKFSTTTNDYYLKITPTSFVLSAKLESSPSGSLGCIPEGSERNYCITD